MVSAYIEYRRLSPVASFLLMATKRLQSAARKPRADAQRNGDRVLEVAREAFTRLRADASLDDVAKQAGVGAGTLYRHFPTRDELLTAVLSHGLALTAGGVVLGAAAALGLTRLIGNLLYNVSPRDPLVFGSALVVMAIAALAACFLPACRAARTDPVRALRQ
jgi:AcrR family transcriptional regulator